MRVILIILVFTGVGIGATPEFVDVFGNTNKPSKTVVVEKKHHPKTSKNTSSRPPPNPSGANNNDSPKKGKGFRSNGLQRVTKFKAW